MDCIEIKTADNGFVLSYRDPEIVKQNSTSDGWTDPYRSRVYDTPQALTADLEKLLPIMAEFAKEEDEVDEYKSAIAEAFSKGDSL